MAIGNEHYDLLGISAGHVGPVRYPIHVPFPERVNALYGQNGVGKSWVLRMLESALGGASPGPDTGAYEHRPGKAFAHLHVAVHDPEDNDVFASPLLGAIFHALAQKITTSRGRLIEHGENPGDVFDIDEDGLEGASLTALACSYIRLVGRVRGWEDVDVRKLWDFAEEGRFTLAASGTDDFPRWHVQLARKPSSQEAELLIRSNFNPAKLSSYLIDDKALFILLDYAGRHPKAPSPIPIPNWVQTPVFDLGIEISVSPVEFLGGVDEEKWNTDYLTRTLGTATRGGESEFTAWTDEAGRVSESALRKIEETVSRANSYLQQVFPIAPQLEFELGTPRSWISGELPHWAFRPEGSAVTFPIEQSLSNSQLRWARIAISIASAQAYDRPTILICDEPEQGLHIGAARRLPGALAYITERDGISAFIASHSHHTLIHPEIHAIRVDRPTREGTTIFHNTISLVDVESRRRSEIELGLTAAELQSLMRVAVVVEGLHDELVFKHLLRKQLDESTAAIFPLHGGRNAEALPAARMMIDGSDAPILVVMDHLTRESIDSAWEEICLQAMTGNTDSALAAINSGLRSGGGASELRFLRQLAIAAIDNGSIDRIEIHGLSRPDVICYLRENEIFTAYHRLPKWDELIHAWENDPSDAVRKGSIKEFLSGRGIFPRDSQERNALIEQSALNMVLKNSAQHPDLVKLGARILELGRSQA